MSILSFMRRASLPFAALLLLALPVRAQQPAVIVSISSVDETMADIQYGAQAAGVPQAAGMVQFVAAQYLNLLDTSAPAGITAVVNGPVPEVLAFLPVKDFAGMRTKIAQQLGPPQDQGNGVWQLQGPQPMFMKQQGKYVFIAQAPAGLNNLPQDPAKLLEGLDKRYNIGARVHIQRIPMQMRQQFLGMMKQNMEQSNQFIEDEAQAAFQKAMSESSLKNIELMTTQGDILEFGLAIDQDKKEIKIEYALTAQPNSELATELSYIQQAETRFGSLVDPGAAVTFNITSKLGQTQTKMFDDMMAAFRSSMDKELSEDANFPTEEARAAAKKVVSNLIDVAEATAKSGKMDSVGALSLDGASMQFAAAVHIAEGQKLDQTVREIVELAKDEPDFPGAQLDVAKVGDVSIHLMEVPVPAGEEDARAVFGDKVEIAVGVGGDAAYLCVGAGAVDRLKTIAAASGTKSVQPMSMRASVGQLIKFGAQFNNDPEVQQMVGVVNQMGDRDHVEVLVSAIPNGARYSIRVEDGILKMVGFGVQKAMAGGGF